jgi:hypothetical protein
MKLLPQIACVLDSISRHSSTASCASRTMDRDESQAANGTASAVRLTTPRANLRCLN